MCLPASLAFQLSFSFFFSHQLQSQRAQEPCLARWRGGVEAEGEKGFPTTDGFSWRRRPVGGKNKDALSDYIPTRSACSMSWSREVTHQHQNKITQMPGSGDFRWG